MKRPVPTLTICVAAPDDVKKERGVIESIVAAWNARSDADLPKLDVIYWSKDAYPAAGARTQQILNKQLVDRADILVGVFWSRFGSPTGAYASGTEEEIRRAIQHGKHVMVYFSDRPISPSEVESSQYQQITEFRRSFSDTGLYGSYKTLDGFRNAFSRHLKKVVQNVVEGTPISDHANQYSPEYHNFITSTKNRLYCNYVVKNRLGDVKVERRDVLRLASEALITRTPNQNIFSRAEFQFAPPEAKVLESSGGRTLKVVGVEPTLRVISDSPWYLYSWYYKIDPPLAEVGDFLNFTTDVTAPRVESEAFSAEGTLFNISC